MNFTLPESNFANWTKTGAAFYCLAHDEQFDVGFAFIKVEGFPQIQEEKDANFFSVSLDDSIIPGESLTFDLHLHLPKNGKFILYKKKNDEIDIRTILKLVQFGVKKVYIRNPNMFSFLTYSACNYIKRKII